MTCQGCGSEDRGPGQRRKSKWGCKLRTCCFERRDVDLCIECDEFPCTEHKGKLSGSHPDDPRFEYRREAVGNLERVSDVGYDLWLTEQETRWRCPECGGRVAFYQYTCRDCGAEVHP
jgi:predicted RNA-binding Zn-ribbon protein involved in translation (DUF1610 family)